MQRRTFISTLAWPAVALALPGRVTAANAPTPQALLQATDRVRGGDLPGVQWTLRLTAHDPDLGADTREMRVRAAGEDSLAETTFPARAVGGRLLQLGRNMWYGRPDLSKAISISNRQKMLGPAANGDIASTNYVGDYDAVLLREEAVGDEPAWVLGLTARSRFVTYDRIEYWVSQRRQVPVRAAFLTVSGKLFKTADIECDNQLTVDGRRQAFISRMTIRDAIQTENRSVLEYRDVQLARVSRHELSVEALTR
jgi:Outer membrane lipoprotein-sorting protein